MYTCSPCMSHDEERAKKEGTYLDHAIQFRHIGSVMLPIVVVNRLLRDVGRQSAPLPGQGG